MLGAGEEGLGAKENQPPVSIDAEVTCDSIALTVEGRTYNLDYDFGRHGVRDLGNTCLVNLCPPLISQRLLEISRAQEWCPG